jgi:uncharacterized protein (DUF1697 family)
MVAREGKLRVGDCRLAIADSHGLAVIPSHARDLLKAGRIPRFARNDSSYSSTMPRKSASATPYVAFLRGINVGGNKIIKMEALKAAFEKLGLKKVRTILASGNVLFEAGETDPIALTRKIETGLEKSLGHSVGVVLRTLEQIEKLEKSAPFKGVPVTPATRLYVTFLKTASGGKTEITNVIDLSEDRGTLDMMADLDKKYGKGITTRNWNTVGRILKAGRSADG